MQRPGEDFNDYVDRREQKKASIREAGSDLLVYMAEHALAALDSNPAAGSPSLITKHTVGDLVWDSHLYRGLNDPNNRQPYPKLTQMTRVATQVAYEVSRRIGEGESLRSATLPDDVICSILPRIWMSPSLSANPLPPYFTPQALMAIDSELQIGGPSAIPDVPSMRALKVATKLFRDAYMQGHPGLQPLAPY